MSSVVDRLGMVLWTVIERTARLLAAIPVNIATIPAGALLFAAGSVLSFLGSGSEIRMRGIELIAWGWDWWPAEVDIEWKV